MRSAWSSGKRGPVRCLNALVIRLLTAIVLAAVSVPNGGAAPLDSPPAFVAPPRKITDITAILDHEKPDAQKISRLRAQADVTIVGDDELKLGDAYYGRAQARALLGRLREAAHDTERAIEFRRKKAADVFRQ